MSELRWKLKTFPGKVKPRTGYVLEYQLPRPPGLNLERIWEIVTIENSDETLVFDQHPLGQAVPKIIDISDLVDEED